MYVHCKMSSNNNDFLSLRKTQLKVIVIIANLCIWKIVATVNKLELLLISLHFIFLFQRWAINPRCLPAVLLTLN